MAPTMLDVYITCLFLFVIVGIIAIYGRVFQRRQNNQDPSSK